MPKTATLDDIKGFKGDKTVKSLELITHWVCGIDKKLLEKEEDYKPLYQNWQLKLYGHWEGRQQQGNWYYMDTDGNVNKVVYESGIVMEETKNIDVSSGLERFLMKCFKAGLPYYWLFLKYHFTYQPGR